MNSYAFDYLSGAEALEDLDLTGAGRKKKKKKKKKAKRAPAAAAPDYGSMFGAFADEGAPADLPELSDADLLPATRPSAGRTMTPEQFRALLAQLRATQTAPEPRQGPGVASPMFEAIAGDSGEAWPQAAEPRGAVDYEAAGEALFTGEEDAGGSFLDAGDFSDLYGGGMDIPAQSPLFRATGAAAQTRPGTPDGRARAAALLNEPRQAQSAARLAPESQAQRAAAAIPMFKAVSGSGCCKCAEYRKYPRRDAIADPF